jgi:hypothetical protein
MRATKHLAITRLWGAIRQQTKCAPSMLGKPEFRGGTGRRGAMQGDIDRAAGSASRIAPQTCPAVRAARLATEHFTVTARMGGRLLGASV